MSWPGLKWWGIVTVAAILAIGIWLNTSTLVEMYGSGPPYYSRTTNMDKWHKPASDPPDR